LENNSRKPRDLLKNRHCDSLKRINLLFLRKGWKGEVVDDANDDEVRINES
jgi:hypothetical protein